MFDYSKYKKVSKQKEQKSFSSLTDSEALSNQVFYRNQEISPVSTPIPISTSTPTPANVSGEKPPAIDSSVDDEKVKAILQELVSQLQSKTSRLQQQSQKIEILEQVIETSMSDNQMLMLELQAFKNFSKGIVARLREAQTHIQALGQQKKQIQLLKSRLETMSQQN